MQRLLCEEASGEMRMGSERFFFELVQLGWVWVDLSGCSVLDLRVSTSYQMDMTLEDVRCQFVYGF